MNPDEQAIDARAKLLSEADGLTWGGRKVVRGQPGMDSSPHCVNQEEMEVYRQKAWEQLQAESAAGTEPR